MMKTLNLSADEKQRGHLDAATVQSALSALREDGIVALADVVSHASIDAVRERMLEDIQTVSRTRELENNFQGLRPPPFAPYLFRDILFNDFVVDITHALLGAGVYNAAYHANTNLPGSPTQHIHADLGQLFPNLKTAHPCCSVVVNVGLSDIDESNGSTEIWPGTHLDTHPVFATGLAIPAEIFAARRNPRPSERMNAPKGTVIIRDIRMWHRGVPNRSNIPRIILAMIHQSAFMAGGPIDFEKGNEAFFEHPVLKTRVAFVDASIDYLYQGQSSVKRPTKQMMV